MPTTMSRPLRIWVDRQDEIALYLRMLAGQERARILLVEAASGMGKSWLLSEFERQTPSDVLCVPVELKKTPLPDVFHLLSQGIGMDNLLRFGKAVRQIVQHEPVQVNVSRNWMFGPAQIEVALQAADEETRRYRRNALTQAMFDDLTALGRRMALLFDTLDGAHDEVREWLPGIALGHVRRCPNVCAVVAGRPPLDVHATWAACCERIVLEGITDPGDWCDGLQNSNLQDCVPSEWVHAYCVGLNGHPFQMALALSNVIRQGAARGGQP